MVDRVRPLKLESPATGGTQDDVFPTGMNPSQDYVACKGVAFEDLDTQRIDIDGGGNMTFIDTISGTKTLADLTGQTSPIALIIALG